MPELSGTDTSPGHGWAENDIFGGPGSHEIGKRANIKRERKQENRGNLKPARVGILTDLFRDPFVLVEDGVITLLFASVCFAFSTGLLVNFTLPKLMALRVGALLLTGLWIYRIKRGEVRPLPRSVFYGAIGLAAWWLFTTFFALHKPTAVHGVYGRYNGLLTHETWLFTFAVMASIPMDMRRVERVLKIFMTVLVPVSLYAILQFYGADLVSWVALEGRSASTIGHPVMLAALLGLALPFAITFFFRTRTNGSRIVWASLFFLFLLAAFTTGSRGPLLGIVVSCSFALVMNLKGGTGMVRRKWLVYGGLSMLLVLFILLFVPGYAGRIAQRVSSGSEVRLRLMYYRTSLNMIKEYPLVGAGFEHFRILYPKYRTPEDQRFGKDVVPTMVHNGYLQAAVTNGIPSVLLYLFFVGSILFLLVRTYLRKTDRTERLLLASFMASLLGFLIQDLTGWLEVSLTTFFYLMLGLAVTLCTSGHKRAAFHGVSRQAVLIVAVISFVGLTYLAIDGINRVHVNRAFWKAQMAGSVVSWPEGEHEVTEALAGGKDDFFYEDMAGTFFSRKLAATGDPSAFARAASFYEKARFHNPFDAYVLVHRIELETQVLRKKLVQTVSPFVQGAEGDLLRMDPYNPTVYETLTKLKLAEEKDSEALSLLRKARDLEGEDKRYYLLEGDLYRYQKDHGKALVSYGKAALLAEKSKPYPAEWLSAKYGQVVSLYESGDKERALEEIKSAVSVFPANPTSLVIMGEIYVSLGDLEKARVAFRRALEIEPSNPMARKGYAKCQQSPERGKGK
jgi:O-antigen ligase/tetratricopeptide (TPR) repeat protein